MSKRSSPWASGPKEILKHGLTLLEKDNDVARRLAMIIIDNAVELTIKTFLGLPKRVTGIHLSRSKFEEISDSFPKLLDALEEHASEKLGGVSLGEIEWYHRLRNQLYHDGNGLTVEREKVEIYAEIAKLILRGLLDEHADFSISPGAEAVGDYIARWSRLERGLIDYSEFCADTYGRTPSVMEAVRVLLEHDKFPQELLGAFENARKVRNLIVHEGGANVGRLAEARKQIENLETWLRSVDSQFK